MIHRPRFGRAAAGVALLLAVAASPLAAETRPPKLDYTIKTLDNGLRVVLLEDHSTPIVHLQLWYHVGSRTSGRAGPGSRTSSST